MSKLTWNIESLQCTLQSTDTIMWLILYRIITFSHVPPLKKKKSQTFNTNTPRLTLSLCVRFSITPGFHSLSFSCSLLHRKFLRKYKSIVLWWVSIRLAVGFQRYSAPNFILLFLYIRKNVLIFNRRCACVKYMLPKFYRYTSGFTKKRQEAVGIAVVVPRL